MDWPASNPIPTPTFTDATSALSSLSEITASGFYNSSTVISSALTSIGDAQFFEESISPSTVRNQLTLTGDPSNASTTLNLLKGMKYLLANMSKGRNVSDFFSYVVKLVAIPNLEVRKMVYIYLARYANHDASCREMALLSINAFQRGLSDREPLCRSLALRVLTAMDVPDVLQLQILGVRTCIKDTSPYVRKCAVNAVGKLYPRCLPHDLTQAEALVEIVTKVLEEDGSTMVLTSAMIAFCEICPSRLELLHGCYRKLCHLLTDMDEWGQVMVMDALMRYCRMFFKRPGEGRAERIDAEKRITRGNRRGGATVNSDVGNSTKTMNSGANALDETLLSMAVDQPKPTNINGSTLPTHPPRQKTRRVVRKAFYSDEEDESSEEEVPSHYPITGGNVAGTLRDHSLVSSMGSTMASKSGFRDDVHVADDGLGKSNGTAIIGDQFEDDEGGDLNKDHKLLLDSSLPLLKSRNSAVVLAVCSLHYYCGIASIKIRTALGKALVRIHRDRREIQYIVLVSIRTLVLECPSAFTPFLNDFFVKGMDPSFTRKIKLDILVSLCIDPPAIEAVLSELRTYVRHNDKTFVCASVRAVGKIAELARVVYDRRALTAELNATRARADANQIALNCLSGLVTLSEFSRNEMVVGECAETMQCILAQLWSCDRESGAMVVNDPTKVQERVLKRLFLILARGLSADNDDEENKNVKENQLSSRTIRVPDSALASILWIIGEWSTMPERIVMPWAVDKTHKSKLRLEVLRLLAKSFTEVDSQTKLQAVHLSSKILLMLKADHSLSDEANRERALCEFVLAMGRVDVLQDVRDRCRYESGILQMSIGLSYDTSAVSSIPHNTSSISLEKARTMLLQPKLTASSLPLDGKELGSAESEDLFRFGTLSSILGYKSGGQSQSLPNWADANSPSLLRDASVLKQKSGVANKEGHASDLYSSSSSDDDSSSDDSSSSSGSSEQAESDSSSDESSEDDTPAPANVFEMAGINNQTTVAPTLLAEAPIPSLSNNDSENSSSSSSSDDSDDSNESESDDSGEEGPHHAVNGSKAAPAVGTILDMDAVSQSTIPTQYATQVSNASSTVAAGLEDLVMTPLVVDTGVITNSTANGESSSWKEYVRPELGGGLLVKMRFLRGSSRTRECQIMGLDPENPSTVCLQVHIENMRTDAGTLRHVRIVHRQGTSSGTIGPSRVIAPPEIMALNKGEVSIFSLGIAFASATDRDGISVAKFDVKSDRGSTPVEIRPTLGEFLDATKTKSISQTDFDTAVNEMHGIHQRTTSTFSLSPVDKTMYQNVPSIILQQFNLKQISPWPGRGCFIGTLPSSGQTVYVVIECDPITGHGDITVCCNNAIVSNSIANLLKQALSIDK